MKIKTAKAWGCGWGVACSRLSDSGEDAKEKGTRKVGGEGKRKKEGSPPPLSPVSSRFIFLFALSQFSGPDYLGAWNRLGGERRKFFFSLRVVLVLARV